MRNSTLSMACFAMLCLTACSTTPTRETVSTSIRTVDAPIPVPVGCLKDTQLEPVPEPTFTTNAQIKAADAEQRAAATDRDYKALVRWMETARTLLAKCAVKEMPK